MSDELKPTYQDDEIDLFELIETLWKEKFLIILFTVLLPWVALDMLFWLRLNILFQ